MNTLLQLAILVINIFIYAGMFYLLYRFVRKIPEIDLYLSQFRKQKHNTDNDKNKKEGLHFFLGDGFFARGIDRNLIRVKK